MTIYDRLVGSIPVNKISACGFTAKDFMPTDTESKINELVVEMRQIDKTLSTIKNNNYIGTKERNDIVKRRYEVEEELRRLKKAKREMNSLAFSNVFFRLCKEKLPEKVYKEIYDSANDVIKYAKTYLTEESQ